VFVCFRELKELIEFGNLKSDRPKNGCRFLPCLVSYILTMLQKSLPLAIIIKLQAFVRRRLVIKFIVCRSIEEYEEIFRQVEDADVRPSWGTTCKRILTRPRLEKETRVPVISKLVDATEAEKSTDKHFKLISKDVSKTEVQASTFAPQKTERNDGSSFSKNSVDLKDAKISIQLHKTDSQAVILTECGQSSPFSATSTIKSNSATMSTEKSKGLSSTIERRKYHSSQTLKTFSVKTNIAKNLRNLIRQSKREILKINKKKMNVEKTLERELRVEIGKLEQRILYLQCCD